MALARYFRGAHQSRLLRRRHLRGQRRRHQRLPCQERDYVYRWDVSDFDACAEGIRKVKAAVGPIEILVNNAGIVRDGALHKMTRTQWDAVIATNLNALFNMCRQVIEGIPARKFGRIINISSINDTEIDPRARAKLLRRRSLEHRVGAVQESSA